MKRRLWFVLLSCLLGASTTLIVAAAIAKFGGPGPTAATTTGWMLRPADSRVWRVQTTPRVGFEELIAARRFSAEQTSFVIGRLRRDGKLHGLPLLHADQLPRWSRLFDDVAAPTPADQTKEYVEYAAGWPALAIGHRFDARARGWRGDSRITWKPPLSRRVGIPLNIMAGGFLIDSALYALAWATLLAIGAATWRRARPVPLRLEMRTATLPRGGRAAVGRRVLIVVGFLLLGVGINIGTASLCSVLGNRRNAPPPTGRILSPEAAATAWCATIGPPDAHDDLGGREEIRFGLSSTSLTRYTKWRVTPGSVSWIEPIDSVERCWIVEYGWPLGAFQYLEHHDSDELVHRVGLWSLALRNRLDFPLWQTVPPAPIWFGFVVNSLLYAAILWMPFAPYAVRRNFRLKRGRCLKCGYDLRGDLDTGCPECGWMRAEAET